MQCLIHVVKEFKIDSEFRVNFKLMQLEIIFMFDLKFYIKFYYKNI